jgi:Spondin_N
MYQPAIRDGLCRYASLLIVASAVVLGDLPGGQGGEATGRYQVTIKNTNDGQNFSPPVLIVHAAGYQLFELGEPATAALWTLAEEGETGEFLPLPKLDPAVRKVVVAERVHRQRSPVVTAEVEAPASTFLSMAAMLSLTNDGFVAARAVPLPATVGQTVRVDLRAYDAGSEANTESCEHVPCEVHGRRMTSGAEGTVREHQGIRGDRDIPPSRAWASPVLGSLEIRRIE